MLTLKQFLAYCQRNDIQTVKFFQAYNYMSDTTYVRIYLLGTITRGEHLTENFGEDILEMTADPEGFYRWYTLNNDPYFLGEAVRNHMRSKCPRPAFFDDDFLPF